MFKDISFLLKEGPPGRPSIDPVILVKYLLIGYLYGTE